MYTRSAAVFTIVFLLLLSACVRRDGRNADCQWPAEPAAKALDPRRSGDARHLREDVEFAEELAVEHMDANRRPKPGSTIPPQPANQAWSTCFSKLIGQIGVSHGVAPKEVGAFFDQRSLAIDAAINCPFLLIYGLLAFWLAGFIRRRYPPEEGWLIVILMLTLASLVVGVAGPTLGRLWSEMAENIRVGNGHLSYRVDRLPWARHAWGLFALCTALFWCAAAVRYRPRARAA